VEARFILSDEHSESQDSLQENNIPKEALLLLKITEI
jgi:hypothetical protein